MKEGFKKLARSRLPLAGHVERMRDYKVVKRADAQKVEGKKFEEEFTFNISGVV